jgi:hypothetical protein
VIADQRRGVYILIAAAAVLIIAAMYKWLGIAASSKLYFAEPRRHGFRTLPVSHNWVERAGMV